MIFNDIRKSFRKGTMLGRLIYINIAVFVFVEIIRVFNFLFNLTTDFLIQFALPAQLSSFLTKPWTIISYMFVHDGFVHLIFNLLWFYFGGSIFLKYLTNRQIISTYILGGLVGGLLYILAFNYFPVFEASLPTSIAVGSSASVFAILIAIATYVPNYNVNLTFIGNVKLKHIAIFTVILDLLLIPKGNAGGHIAHIGGAIYGYYFSKRLLKGKDISKGFDKLMFYLNSLFKPQIKMKTIHRKAKNDDEWREQKSNEQREINLILEKIAQSGYDSLNKEEKDTLFKASKK
ncbi:MAG: rhomboid family intramembrane serine protease [Flavobacteriales bacterium]